MKIIWTNLALLEYEKVISYLLDEWTILEAQKFVDALNETLKRVLNHPNMFKHSDSFPYLRKAKVSSQTSIIYQIDEDEIVIIRMIDNRGDHKY